ncbi:subtilisin inhibitor [Choanephora cucurbitarum]|nr:subtilisin inhibitor [Choanephora cucurbitarum]
MVNLTLLLLGSAALLVSAKSTRTSLTVESVNGSGMSTKQSLTCDPVGGTHPNAKEACQKMKTFRKKFDTTAVQGTACPSNYDPVTIIIEGKYNNKPFRYRNTFSNSCAAQTKLGAIAAVVDYTR